MKATIKFIFLCVLFLSANANLKAQVTFGANEAPVKAALLELKNYLSAADSTNSSKGGLVLPRVKLVSKVTIQPFIATGDTEWNVTNQAKTRADHIGLTVYNLSDNDDFHPGIYVWTGPEWKRMAIPTDFIALPSFKVNWNYGGGSGSIDLFNDVYKANYTPTAMTRYVSSNGGRVALPEYDPTATDFDYVVTDYDPSVITVTAINASGVMSYTRAATAAADPTPPENAYINVVMVRK